MKSILIKNVDSPTAGTEPLDVELTPTKFSHLISEHSAADKVTLSASTLPELVIFREYVSISPKVAKSLPRRSTVPPSMDRDGAVSYTHLTQPTKRIV